LVTSAHGSHGCSFDHAAAALVDALTCLTHQ
jgi:hypothetical protein